MTCARSARRARSEPTACVSCACVRNFAAKPTQGASRRRRRETERHIHSRMRCVRYYCHPRNTRQASEAHARTPNFRVCGARSEQRVRRIIVLFNNCNGVSTRGATFVCACLLLLCASKHNATLASFCIRFICPCVSVWPRINLVNISKLCSHACSENLATHNSKSRRGRAQRSHAHFIDAYVPDYNLTITCVFGEQHICEIMLARGP